MDVLCRALAYLLLMIPSALCFAAAIYMNTTRPDSELWGWLTLAGFLLLFSPSGLFFSGSSSEDDEDE